MTTLHQVALYLSRIFEQLKISCFCERKAFKKFEEHGINENLKRSA